MKAQELDEPQEDGLLTPVDWLSAHAPKKDMFPEPRPGERVCLVDFLHWGFSFPLHDFVHGLLYAYGIQMDDLTPNKVLYIVCFITLCECFLGVHPH